MADKQDEQSQTPERKPRPKTVPAGGSMDMRAAAKAGGERTAKPAEAKEAVAQPAANPLESKSEVRKPVGGKPAAEAARAATVSTTDGGKPAGRRRPGKGFWIKLGAVVASLVIIAVGVFAVLIYGFRSSSSLVYAVSGVVPYPAERVNGKFVSYHDYLFEVNANQKAYVSNAKLNNQTAVSWTSAEGKKMLTQIRQHALDKLKNDVLTADLARKYKVSVSDKEVNDLVATLYQKYGGKDTLLKTLSQIYGWNLEDLKHVVKRQLLAQKVQQAVAKDPAIDAQVKAKAEDVHKKLVDGADFAATAKLYSQASDASSGGDLGAVAKGQVEDAVYNAASALQPGALSDVIKTQYGYQIIKVGEKTDANIKLQHILIKNLDFNTFLSDQAKTAKVKSYIKVS